MSEAQTGKASASRPASVKAARVDLEHDIVQVVLARQPVVVVTGEAGSGKTLLSRRIAAALSGIGVRVVQIASPDRLPLAVRGILDQVIDPGGLDDDDERVRQLCAALIEPQGGERQLTLVIDDADMLSPRGLGFLEMIVAAGALRALPLQVVLVGRPQLLDLLSPDGRFGPHQICKRRHSPDQGTPCPPNRKSGVDEARRRDQALSELWSLGIGESRAPALVGTALAVSRPASAADVFRFDSTAARSAAPPRARPIRWLAAALLLAAPSTGALYSGFQFRPAAIFAAFVAAPGLTDLVGRRQQPGSIPAPVAPPPQPAAAAAPAISPDAVSPGTLVSAAARRTDGPDTEAAEGGAVGTTIAAAAPLGTAGSHQEATTEHVVLASSSTPPERSIEPESVLPQSVPQPASGLEPQPAAEASLTERRPAPMERASVETPSSRASEVGAAATVAAAAPSTPQPSVDPPMADPPEVLAVVLAHGNALLKSGDVDAARQVYEQAARSGLREAAVAAGQTYDPSFVGSAHGRGIRSDRQAAAAWYRRAVSLGDGKAAGLLARLSNSAGE